MAIRDSDPSQVVDRFPPTTLASRCGQWWVRAHLLTEWSSNKAHDELIVGGEAFALSRPIPVVPRQLVPLA